MRHSLEEGPRELPRSENINNLGECRTLQFLCTFTSFGPYKNPEVGKPVVNTHISLVRTQDSEIIQLLESQLRLEFRSSDPVFNSVFYFNTH